MEPKYIRKKGKRIKEKPYYTYGLATVSAVTQQYKYVGMCK